MKTHIVPAITVALMLGTATAARAELLRVELKTLGMD